MEQSLGPVRTPSPGRGLAASEARTPSLHPPPLFSFPWCTTAMACLLGTVLAASGYVALLATFAFLAYIVDLSVPFPFLLYFYG